jgi:dihydrofolate reductase
MLQRRFFARVLRAGSVETRVVPSLECVRRDFDFTSGDPVGRIALNMGKVFFDVGMSLDGFIAGPNARPGNPLGDGGVRIHEWIFKQASFLGHLGLPGQGEIGPDNEMVKALFARAGAYVMGRRMFDEGEVGWPEEAPFHAPVFVLTHNAREPWVRKGGTTFYFVADDIMSALRKAQTAAGEKDVRISGGAQTIRQFVSAGLIDDFTIHLAAMLLGRGVRLFDQIEPQDLPFERTKVIDSPLVTHMHYHVVR